MKAIDMVRKQRQDQIDFFCAKIHELATLVENTPLTLTIEVPEPHFFDVVRAMGQHPVPDKAVRGAPCAFYKLVKISFSRMPPEYRVREYIG